MEQCSSAAVLELWQVEFGDGVVGVSGHVRRASIWFQNFVMERRHQSWGGPFRRSLRDDLLWSQCTADLSASMDWAAGIFPLFDALNWMSDLLLEIPRGWA